MKSLRLLLPWVWLAILLAGTMALRCWNAGQVFIGGEVYFVDADCYSRMTRVAQLLETPWTAIRTHDFENAPIGTEPHTTAPMDLLIAALAGILGLGTANGTDLAGAWISPLLGTGLVAFLWWWGKKLHLPFRNALLILVAASPILVHGFLLGRPDHQSLVLLLVGMALAAEIGLWTQPTRLWSLLSASAWALALWTSLFEPLILLLATLICRFLVLGRLAWTIRHPAAPALFFVLLLGGLLFDGWRSPPSAPEIAEFFPRWSQTIGELNHLTPVQLMPWTGWLLPIVPVLLLLRHRREKNRLFLALALLVLLTAALSLWYARWGYFLALVFALSLPFALASIPSRPVVWTLFVLSLWPLASEWDRQLFPDAKRTAALAEQRTDAVLLRETARAMVSPEQSVFLAPWWLSPALAYWSGQKGVAGSSHQSLPGIADSARFYLAEDAATARSILGNRRVTFVVAYEPSRVIPNSARILGQAIPRRPMGRVLYDQPATAPGFLRLVYENRFFRLYETAPPAGSPAVR